VEEPSPQPDDGYRSLSVADVMADLPRLDVDQLLLVKSLEEASERRPVVLDRIDALLQARGASPQPEPVTETPPVRKPSTAARPLSAHQAGPAAAGVPKARITRKAKTPKAAPQGGRVGDPEAAASPRPADPEAAASPRPAEPKTATSRRPAEPKAPNPRQPDRKAAGNPRRPEPQEAGNARPSPHSPAPTKAELTDQMGTLLARDEARRSPMQVAWPLPDVGTPDAPGGRPAPSTPVAGPLPAPAPAPATGPPQGALIVPDNGHRRTNVRRITRFVPWLLVVAVLAGAGALYWKDKHPTGSTTPNPVSTRLAALLVATPGFTATQVQTTASRPWIVTNGSATSPGFVAGVERQFLNTAVPAQQAWVYVLQFQTPAQSAAYAAQVAATFTAPTKTSFSTPGVPGAMGSSNQVKAVLFTHDVFTRGTYMVDIVLSGPASNGVVPQAQALAHSQYAAIPAAN
jgi:hypothetical protein